MPPNVIFESIFSLRFLGEEKDAVYLESDAVAHVLVGTELGKSPNNSFRDIRGHEVVDVEVICHDLKERKYLL